MMILDNLVLFLRIVEKGGLAAAGRELGLSAASVSERLVALEKYYGAALLHRTTRAINLTDEGRLLVQGARRLLAEADWNLSFGWGWRRFLGPSGSARRSMSAAAMSSRPWMRSWPSTRK